ncbi:RYamide receptor [Anthophora quadrimaculata]
MNTSSFNENEGYEHFWSRIFNSTYQFSGNVSMDDDFAHSYEVPMVILVILSMLYGTISVLAVVGNGLVMWIIATSRRMQNVTNYFIANLAFADIIIGLFAIPFQFQAALLQRWNLPYFMCAFCPFVRALSVNVSIFTLTAIAIDRHRAILKPLSAKPSKLTAKVIIAGIWILAVGLATPMAIALRVIMVPESRSDSPDHYKPFCIHVNLSDTSMLIYTGLLVFLQYLTPLSIISCVYVRMALKLWGNKAPGNAEDSRDVNLMKNKMREKFKREFQQRCPFKSRKWLTSPPINTTDTDKTQSTRTSIRYEWRRTISGTYPSVSSFYKGVSTRESSQSFIEDQMSERNRKGIGYYIRSGNHCTNKSEELYVFPSGKHMHTQELDTEELCL